MLTANQRLIDKCLALNPSGTIGDGMVAELRDLAKRARDELPQRQRGNISGVQILPGVPRVPVVCDGGRCRHCGAPR